MPSDRQLVARMQTGDAAAFDELFERHEPEVRRRVLRIVRDEVAAEDLVQEVFLRLWTKADQWRGGGPLAAWLGRAATNLALNWLRSTKRRRHRPLELQAWPESEEDDDPPIPGWMIDEAGLRPDELAEQHERHERVRSLVEALPEQRREVLRLAHEAEMDLRAIGEALGIPYGTVKSRLHYARAELAKAWIEIEGKEEP